MNADRRIAPGFVYIAQCGDLPRYKIGSTTDPLARISALQTVSPFEVVFVRILDVGGKGRANAFEGMVLGWMGDKLARGEWTSDLDAALALFDCIAPAVDVTDDYPAKPLVKKSWRVAISDEQLEFRLALADMEAAGKAGWAVFTPVELAPRRDGFTPHNWRNRIDAALSPRAAA